MSTHPIARRTVLGAAAAAALCAPHIARAAPRLIKLGHNSIETSQYGQGCRAFANAALGHPDLMGVVRIEVHGNGEFGDELAMVADCRSGAVDMIAGVSSAASVFCPEIGLLDVPFVFKDVGRGRAAFDGALGEEYTALLETQGIHLVGWLENGLRHITANRPIRVPGDMAGLRMRVLPSQVALDSFRALGADAKALPFNQLHEALRTGQFEAQENPIAAIETIKLNEVQRYLCLSGHSYSIGMLCASPDVMEELTPTQIRALRECARHGTQRSREVAQAGQVDGVGRLERAGMSVVANVDTDAFTRAARPNIEGLGAKFGTDRVQRLLKAAG